MLENFAQITFWLTSAVLMYVYIGYPLLVYAVSRIRPRAVKKADFEPSVTVLITAYNEERDLRAKLENTLLIDYPKEKLEILVASDCSTDKTDEIVKEFAASGVKLYRQTQRLGKTMAQNAAVEVSNGEIVLFSDATTMYQSDVLRKMLPNFADETIGCVAGKLIYVDDSNSNIGKGAQSYWSYETFLKESESRACSVIGASGCLYAVRKSAYRQMYPEACSDFLICTIIYEQNLRSIYEPAAVCTEETNRRTDKEFQMRVRVISQTFNDLWRNRRIMNPFKNKFFALQIISHKLLRYAVPLFLILVFFSSLALAYTSNVFAVLFAVQLAFHLSAGIGWLLEKNGKSIGVFAIPLYFSLANLAATIAFYKFLCGEHYASWEPIREAKDGEEKAAATFNQTA